MMAIWQLALSFVLAAPTTAASPVEMPPTPAEQVLRAIVSADVTRQTLQAAIRRCATRAPRPKTCETERALEAATADSCEAIYGGKVLEVCTDLGLWRLQWASLWLAVMDLRTSHG